MSAHRIRLSDHTRFRDGRMLHQAAFHLEGPHVLARRDDEVVDTSLEPEVTVGIPISAVARDVPSRNAEVTLVPLGLLPDGPHHPGPARLHYQVAQSLGGHFLSIIVHDSS